jgi:cbb3-type cytochrome c oxidase subunit III
VTRLAALLSVGLLAGCGTGGLGQGETAGADGAALFKDKCQTCHTLAAAGTNGKLGPNLDAAFAAARKEGFDESTIREVVLGQMRFPIKPMPEPDELFPIEGNYTEDDRERDMEAIATYVASVAANEQAIAQATTQTGEGTAASDPKALFQQNCAGCHTFAAAGAAGNVGPNLDQLQLPVSRIEQQIRKGGGVMPPFEGKLTDAQIKALAKWVAENRKG